MKYIPAEDCEGLKKQFYALASLVESKQQQITLLKEQVNQMLRENLKVSYNNMELESLREMNQVLTDRVLFLEEALGNLSNNISRMNK